MEVLLEAEHVSKGYRRGNGKNIEVLSDVSLQVMRGQCLGLVGESGCGKSTLCRLLAGLERPSSGRISYEGRLMENMKRQRKIQMVFQNSFDAVCHHMTAFQIIAEPLENFFGMGKRAARMEAGRLMEMVGLPAADMAKYPAQFSGGQLQRICIARALAARPERILLDEPLSSLDVSVQAQILNLLADLKKEQNLTYILVSHDLKAVYYLSDTILVMKQGRVTLCRACRSF